MKSPAEWGDASLPLKIGKLSLLVIPMLSSTNTFSNSRKNGVDEISMATRAPASTAYTAYTMTYIAVWSEQSLKIMDERRSLLVTRPVLKSKTSTLPARPWLLAYYLANPNFNS